MDTTNHGSAKVGPINYENRYMGTDCSNGSNSNNRN